MRRSATLWLLLLLAVACKKDAAVTVAYNSTYFKARVDAVGAMRAFTQAGEITNTASLAAFIATDTLFYSSLAYNLVTGRDFLDSVSFKSPSSAVIEYYGTNNDY